MTGSPLNRTEGKISYEEINSLLDLILKKCKRSKEDKEIIRLGFINLFDKDSNGYFIMPRIGIPYDKYFTGGYVKNREIPDIYLNAFKRWLFTTYLNSPFQYPKPKSKKNKSVGGIPNEINFTKEFSAALNCLMDLFALTNSDLIEKLRGIDERAPDYSGPEKIDITTITSWRNGHTKPSTKKSFAGLLRCCALLELDVFCAMNFLSMTPYYRNLNVAQISDIAFAFTNCKDIEERLKEIDVILSI